MNEKEVKEGREKEGKGGRKNSGIWGTGMP